MKELSLHILDIVQNAITANADNISISIMEDTKEDVLIITINDDGDGMDEHLVKQVINPFTTSRKTRRVGMGLPLLKQAAIECEGDLHIESELTIGTKVEVWFKHSHINRVPIGNMVETIITLLINGSHFNLQYKHKVNQHQMTFDTREIRQVLGDVPLSHPDVIQWVKQSLQDEIMELYQYYKG